MGKIMTGIHVIIIGISLSRTEVKWSEKKWLSYNIWNP